MRTLRTLALFCRVVDNYGDIGICWRLARQLCDEHGIAVTLWVDDLRSFRRLCPEVCVSAPVQLVAGVTVRHWTSQEGEFAPQDVADIVIEFFAVDIPPGYIDAMAQCEPQPVWLNLEGLTAEEWVEGCHLLPSPHPRLPLTKYFFFPGFTPKTGGLLREAGLTEARAQFEAQPFLAQLGLSAAESQAFKVSLFCYAHAPVATLLSLWQHSVFDITCLVPEGVAAKVVEDFLGAPAVAGAVRSCGALTVRVLPFVPQPDYDKLLWSCDLNFVRGEDSWVRAQWARKPFVWHIYPQDENLHHKKLRAFLGRYCADIASLSSFSLWWNEAGVASDAMWSALHDDVARIARRAAEWEADMLTIGDMTANLLAFARSR